MKQASLRRLVLNVVVVRMDYGPCVFCVPVHYVNVVAVVVV